MAGEQMSKALLRYQKRYLSLDRKGRSLVLDEFCLATGYHRKYAIALLRKPVGATEGQAQRRRGVSYPESAIRVLERIWEAAGYPWSVRLKAMLPLWLPQARKRVRGCTAEVEAQLLRMSARQMDRRLAEKKRKLKRRIYGHTKPGSLLKHHIPIKTDHWDVTAPGYCEIDLVSHSGPCAAGEFIYSLNVTDIHTGWSETRAIMGKSEGRVVEALEDIRRSLPFALKAIDSDNGSEFINYHLAGYCDEHNIQFTRGRPYKKNDNAHIEQKNWTHVRRIFGWDRYDTTAQLEAMNRLYRGDLSTMMNFFQPCVKLSSKARIGSKLKRLYDQAATPLDRLCQAGQDNPAAHLYLRRRETVDPFELSKCIEKQLQQLTILQGHPKKPAA